MTGRTIRKFTIDIMGKPIVWARTTTTPEGKRVNPTRYRAWKQHAIEVLRAGAGYRTFNGEVAVDIELHPDRVTVTVQALGTERRPGTGLQGDVDNYAKAVLDALEAGGVITNDKEVTQLTVRIYNDSADDDEVREATVRLADRYQDTLEELA